MHAIAERVTDKVSARSAGPTHQAAPGRLSPVVGIAIHFLGVGVEALGLGLVVAYGLLAAGGALSICGPAIGLLREPCVASPAEAGVALSAFFPTRLTLG